jgi:hypothetical protein
MKSMTPHGITGLERVNTSHFKLLPNEGSTGSLLTKLY